MAVVGFLHTTAAHTATFERLVADLAADVTPVSVVDAEALTLARRLGPDSDAVRARVAERLGELAHAGAEVIVCTCSTIGGAAEDLGASTRVPVLRVDRPMIAEALTIGHRITVIVAVESTVRPTRQLLEEIAQSVGARPEVAVHVCDGAWARFEAGDNDGYVDAVARRCDEVAASCDVIVLAQASMAAAAARCRTTVPVLSSPASAVRKAVDLVRSPAS